GERGSLVADYGASTVTLHLGEHSKRGDAWEAVETGKEELPTRREEPLRLELRAFLDACAGRAANPVPVAAGVRALDVVEAAGRRPGGGPASAPGSSSRPRLDSPPASPHSPPRRNARVAGRDHIGCPGEIERWPSDSW